MLEFHEARRRLLAFATPLGAERVELRRAAGRVLARAIRSAVDIPRFENSAMDGYAVRFDDLPVNPVGSKLEVVGESRAGSPGPALRANSAQRIFTGAPLPVGADTVVIQEDVERNGEFITLQAPVQRGDHVRHVGEDVQCGQEVLTAGTRLGAYHLGLLASLDYTTVSVARRPRVAILCTGDELRLPGMSVDGPTSPSASVALPESNGIAVATLAELAGAEVTLLPLGPDRIDELTPMLSDALSSSDVVVTIGGVSVGDYDVVQDALRQVGVQIEFYKVKMRPGKPLVLGRHQGRTTLGLPGNPVSAQVTATLFLLPFLRRLQGDTHALPVIVKRKLRHDCEQKPGRRAFLRATVEDDEVTVHRQQGSGSVLSMAQANALVTFHEDSSGARAGEFVDTLLLSDV